MGLRDTFTAWRVRRAFDLLRRHGYDAARPSSQDGWAPVHEQINHLITSASPQLRNRVRDLVRNFPVFQRALSCYSATVVGRGPRFMSLAVHPDGTPALEARRRIEERFNAWMEDDADVSGGMHFYELQQLLCRQLLEGGEGFFAFVPRRRYGVTPLALMPIEAERVTSLSYRAPGTDGTDLWAGVEYVKETGEALAYHVAQDGYGAEIARVPAEDMLHVFQRLRPGQLRGVTPLASAVLVARAMSDYTQSELDASKMASKYMAIVTSDDLHQFQTARGIAGAGKPAQEKRIEYLENSIIEYLRPGEKIEFANPSARPGDSFDRFNRFAIRMVSVTIDVDYSMLSGDYTGINYSTSKAMRGDSRLLLAPHSFMHTAHFLRPVFRRWLDTEAVTQDYLPAYWQNPRGYQAGIWIPPGQSSVDPQRDGRADIEAIAAGLKSPQECILARGGDPEEVLAQLAAWQRSLAEYGVELGKVSGSLSSAPSALEDQPTQPAGNAEDCEAEGGVTQTAENTDENAHEGMMNGAQVTSIVDLVAKVNSGEIPAATGVKLLQVAFDLDEETAQDLIGG